jgi:hypothetical protein
VFERSEHGVTFTRTHRRSSYHGAAMDTEAVRFLVLWMAGRVNALQLVLAVPDSCVTARTQNQPARR